MAASGVARFARAAIAATLLALALPAAADYPDRPIHLVVPFPPGGSADAAARAIAQPLSLALGQPVLVDNRPGADGVIAGTAVSAALPDGYTLLVGGATGMSYAPNARRQLPYDPQRSFAPVGRFNDGGFFLYVHESVPARTADELLAFARVHPDALNCGSASAFGLLSSVVVAKAAAVSLTGVPYKGEAPMFQDLLAGRIQMTIASGSGLPHASGGRLRILATTLASRSRLTPDVPTFAEAGLKGVDLVSWQGIFAPAGTPREIVERLSRELRTALSRPDVRDRLEQLGLQSRPSTAAELAALVQEQLASWQQAMTAADIKPE